MDRAPGSAVMHVILGGHSLEWRCLGLGRRLAVVGSDPGSTASWLHDLASFLMGAGSSSMNWVQPHRCLHLLQHGTFGEATGPREEPFQA